jgi:hypothetical protein
VPGCGQAEQGVQRESAAASAEPGIDVAAVAVDAVAVAADAAFAGSGAHSALVDLHACQEKAAVHEGTAVEGSLGVGVGIVLDGQEGYLAARCPCSEHAS